MNATQSLILAPAKRTHCPRGHRLAGANLVESALMGGRRACLICSRAYSKMQNERRAGREMPFEDALALEVARTDGDRADVLEAAMA